MRHMRLDALRNSFLLFFIEGKSARQMRGDTLLIRFRIREGIIPVSPHESKRNTAAGHDTAAENKQAEKKVKHPFVSSEK